MRNRGCLSRGLFFGMALLTSVGVGCGGGGSGGEAPQLVLNAPGQDVVVTVGRNVSIDGFVQDNDSPALVTIIADRDGDPATRDDQILISPTVTVQGGELFSQLWQTQAVPPGTYTIFGTVTDGANRVNTFAGGMVSVIDRQVPDGSILSPLENVEVVRGAQISIEWQASTSDGFGTASLFLDMDGNTGTRNDRVVLFEDRPLLDGPQTVVANTSGLPIGNYRVILVVDDGLGVPRTATSIGSFEIRSVPAGFVISGAGDDRVTGVAAHLNGERTIVGNFEIAADLNLLEAAGVTETDVTFLQSVSSTSSQALIVRTRNDGTIRWSVQPASAAETTALRVKELPDAGVVVIGTFRDTLFFNAGTPEEIALAPRGERDVYVVRLDADGAILWARGLGGAGDDQAEDLVVFPDGTLAVAGQFTGGDVDVPSAGGGGAAPVMLTGFGAIGFVARLAPDGDVLWALAAPDGTSRARALAALAGGALVIGGTGVGAPGAAPDGGGGVYLTRLDAAGNAEWFRRDGNANVSLEAITTVEDNIVVTGAFVGAATFAHPAGPSQLAAPLGDSAMYLARYNSTGTLRWLRRSDDVATVFPHAMTAMPDGGVTVVGRFGGGLATFQAERLVGTNQDMFVVQYDRNGVAKRVARGGGPNGDATGLAASATLAGTVVIGGTFLGEATFEDIVGETGLGTTDGFVAEFFSLPALVAQTDD